MLSKILFYIISLSLFTIIFINNPGFAQEFNADDTSSFNNAISRANASPESSHIININGDIILDSPIAEAISLELSGSNSTDHYNFSLNGNSFTYNGADKISKISNLNVVLDNTDCGIFVNNQTLTIDNTDFTSDMTRNSYGFLNNRDGSLKINNSNFTGNTNRLGGGAIHNSGTSFLDINNSIITKNNGDNGGGIFFNNGTATIKNTELSNNLSSRDGGAIYINSGELNISDSVLKNNTATTSAGALCIKSGAKATIDNTSFDNNTVLQASRGGAVYNEGTTIINNSSFTNNSVAAGAGGAIINSGTLTIDNTLFDNNYVLNDGGAITDTGTLTITNSKFSNNSSTGSFAGAIMSSDLKVSNTIFDNNSANSFGGAVVVSGNADISDSTFTNNKSETSSGGALVNLYGKVDLKGANIFKGNTSEENGGAIHSTAESITNLSGTANFMENTAKTGLGGAIFTQGTVNINADNPDSPVIFSGNKDSTGNNAFHLDISASADEGEVGTMNLNVSNGAKIVIEDNISGVAGTKLNIKGTSSYDDKVYLGSANENFKSDITTENINLNFHNEFSGLANANISAFNTHFNLMNGFVTKDSLNIDLSPGGNSLSIDVDPAAQTCDYINIIGDPADMTQLTIRDINVLSDPIKSVTIFDLFDHDKYGTDLALSEELQNSTVYGALKTYRWSLTPKLTLIELGGLNPNIQRFQGATSAAFMNQMLSYDYSLNRTDEIYTNLREQKLASRRLNSYASAGPSGMYVDQHYEDGSAFWMRPYVNLESFHLSGAAGTVNNQSYGTMIGFDFPMLTTKNDWKLFPTIYGSYIGSSQQYLDSNMYQNGGYGGFLLSAYKDNFYTGWTINGGGLGVQSRYNSGKDDYAIITAGTALRLAYNWKFLNRFILQPNFTTAYTFLSPSNLVNFQSLDINQSQVNGLTIAPSLRLTYRNEDGFEPYIFGGCVIPIMSDVKANIDGINVDKMTLNAWAQFGAGIRKRISERVTAFAETIIRTGGRSGWGFMFNIEIAI